jgi:hypothetical protein
METVHKDDEAYARIVESGTESARKEYARKFQSEVKMIRHEQGYMVYVLKGRKSTLPQCHL